MLYVVCCVLDLSMHCGILALQKKLFRCRPNSIEGWKLQNLYVFSADNKIIDKVFCFHRGGYFSLGHELCSLCILQAGMSTASVVKNLSGKMTLVGL